MLKRIFLVLVLGGLAACGPAPTANPDVESAWELLAAEEYEAALASLNQNGDRTSPTIAYTRARIISQRAFARVSIFSSEPTDGWAEGEEDAYNALVLEAARGGIAEAQALYAAMLEDRIQQSTEIDHRLAVESEALEWRIRAAEGGDMGSLFFLLEQHCSSGTTDIDIETLTRRLDAISNGVFREDQPFARDAKTRADVRALFQGRAGRELGYRYAMGDCLPRDLALARRYYSRAIDADPIPYLNANDLEVLMLRLAGHEGRPVQLDQAAAWAAFAAENGVFDLRSNAHDLIGQYAAFVLNLAAAQKGDARAAVSVAMAYEFGEVVPADLPQAYAWYKIASTLAIDDPATAQRATSGTSYLASRDPRSAEIGERIASDWLNGRLGSGNAQVDRSGSGFVVSHQGYVITNFHVVEGCASISSPQLVDLELVAVDQNADLALARTSQLGSLKPIVIRTEPETSLGEDVVSAGFPLSGIVSPDLNVTAGNLSALTGPGRDRSLLQFTAPVQAGSSGGPVVDMSGNLIGVVVAKLDALAVAEITGDVPQNVNFAVATRTLMQFLEDEDIDYEVGSSELNQSRTVVAEFLLRSTIQIRCN